MRLFNAGGAAETREDLRRPDRGLFRTRHGLEAEVVLIPPHKSSGPPRASSAGHRRSPGFLSGAFEARTAKVERLNTPRLKAGCLKTVTVPFRGLSSCGSGFSGFAANARHLITWHLWPVTWPRTQGRSAKR